jgi:AcrR family transcriptional regulator
MENLEPADTRTRILDAAEEIARNQGLNALSMRAIAVRIGLSAPAAYRHFRSKDRIIQAMIERGYNRFIQGLKAARQNARSPEELLATTIRYYLQFWVQDRTGFRLASEWSRNTPSLTGTAIETGSFGDLPDLIKAILADSRTPEEIARISRWTAAALYGLTLSLVQDEAISQAQETEYINSATEFLMRTIRAFY